MVFYREECKKMNKEDPPELFGLHFNAEISAQIQDNLELIDNIRVVSPDLISSSGSVSIKEEFVLQKINFALDKLPNQLNLEAAKAKIYLLDKNAKSDPVIHVLFQESTRYNNLIALIRQDLQAIESALKGNTILTPNLEKQINTIYEDHVPMNWMIQSYNSTKPFPSYILDLIIRVDFFASWLNNGITPNYFLGYFSNPAGFITAVKQKFSLENKISFNKVKLDFKVINEDEQTKLNKMGYLIKGVWIEGGQWDKKYTGIKDENIQDLYTPLPPILMIPINDELSNNNAPQIINPGMLGIGPLKHWFPLYYIPNRGDSLGKSSYVMDICLNVLRDKDKDGLEKTDREYISYWIKKGTCLLLSKND
jgi:dynein heavy chain